MKVQTTNMGELIIYLQITTISAIQNIYETQTGYSATNNTAYISSNKIEEKTQRRFYRVNITKPENGAASFHHCDLSIQNRSWFEKDNIDAKFIDNTENKRRYIPWNVPQLSQYRWTKVWVILYIII